MARLKYSDDVEPIRNKHYGFTFQRNHYGQSMAPSGRTRKTRNTRQFSKMQNLQKAVKFWRNMEPATKTAWDNFAAAYPQPSKKSSSVFLSGYQLFLKRNHYIFLNNGIECDFMELPEMVSLPAGAQTFEITAGSNSIDITEAYLLNFGELPATGQWLQFMAIPYSDRSGQFFAPIYSVLETLNVYVDGLFLNIVFTDSKPDITFSVYLSKPLNKGYIYPSSKVRYMGCFTTKTFLGLTDTPSTYAGQQNKVVAVKADQTGLEFITPSSGGITCSDLPNCPTIIDINSDIQSIFSILINLTGLSIPAVKYGLLYNSYCFSNSVKILHSGFIVPSNTEFTTLVNYLGGTSVAGIKCKESGLTYWKSPNTGATNSAKFNGRGAGTKPRIGVSYGITEFLRMWSTTPFGTSTFICWQLHYNSPNFYNYGGNEFNSGNSIRGVKSPTTLTNGQTGTYFGTDGKIYRTICIGTQEWIADNLAETLMSDGTPITNPTDESVWQNTLLPAYQAYSNNSSYVLI